MKTTGEDKKLTMQSIAERKEAKRLTFADSRYINIAISDAPPAKYWDQYAERFDHEARSAMMQWHALPEKWWTMSYELFLAARRPLIAGVIRRGYQKLAGTTE